MDKKVIMITGASGGLGKSLSNYFYAREYALVLHHFSTPIDFPVLEDVIHVQADLRNNSEIKKAFQEAQEYFGRIDILINNAGVSKSGISWKTSDEDWQETLDINLTAVFLACKHVVPNMRKNKWGRIINISSVVAQTGVIGTVAYAASKAGLFGLTKTLSKELSPSEITVNTLALGYFNTGMINDVPTEIQNDIIEQIPAGKLGDPVTICKTIALLISEEGAYISGQTININGGIFNG